MAVLKVLEIMANSTESWEDATKNAIKEASKTVKHIKSAYIREQSVVVKNDAVSEYRVTVKISFEIE